MASHGTLSKTASTPHVEAWSGVDRAGPEGC